MALFLQLYLGHIIGDFLFQPGRLVVAKRQGVPGLVLHTAIVGLATLLVVSGSLVTDWAPAVLVTGLHLVIERITIATYMKTPTRGLFTFLMDQAMHALSIVLIVWTAGRWSLVSPGTLLWLHLSPVGLAKVAAFATVTLFGSIFVFEAVGAMSGESKGRILRLDGARIYGIVERGVALALALVSPALGLVPFVPRVALAMRRTGDERRLLLAEAGAGLAICAFGFAAIAATALLAHGSAGLGELDLTIAGLVHAGAM